MIITLDKKVWSREELLEKMQDDSFYYEYLGSNVLSSSSVKKLLESPRSYELSLLPRRGSNSALDFGWLFHAAILEPDVYEDQHFVEVKSRNTKAFKEAQEKYGRVFTSVDRWKVERLADAFYSNSTAVDLLSHTSKEVPAVGEIFGLPFRAKADILGDGYIADIKTTTGVENFRYSARKFGYDVQCFIYCKLFDIKPENFWFIAIDKETYGIAIYNCSEEFYEEGKQKVYDACMTYIEYFVDRQSDIGDYYVKGTL